MTQREGCFWTLVVGGFAILIICLFAIAIWNSSPWGCEARWPDSDTRWTLGAWCQVSVDGSWTPEKNVRGWE